MHQENVEYATRILKLRDIFERIKTVKENYAKPKQPVRLHVYLLYYFTFYLVTRIKSYFTNVDFFYKIIYFDIKTKLS